MHAQYTATTAVIRCFPPPLLVGKELDLGSSTGVQTNSLNLFLNLVLLHSSSMKKFLVGEIGDLIKFY